MAADGSVVIKIEGDASDLKKSLQNVAKVIEASLGSPLTGANKKIGAMAREMAGIGSGPLEQASDAIKGIGTSSEQATDEFDQLADEWDNLFSSDVTVASDDLLSVGDAADTATSHLEKLKTEISSQEKEISSLKSKYESAAQEFGETSDEARGFASEIDSVSKKLEKNKATLSDVEQEAEKVGDGYHATASKMSQGFTVLKGTLAGLATTAITRIADSLKNLVGEALTSADAMKKFEGTMSFAGFDVSEISAVKDAVKTYANETVYDLNTVLNTTAQLGANGVKDYEKLTEAAGNLNAVAGGNADSFKSVAMMLTQTAGAGKLTTENWNQLTDAIPGASGKLQQAMLDAGAYTGNFREAMEQGEISAEEFANAIMSLGMTDVAKEAARSTSTIEGAIGNLKASIVDQMTTMLTDGGGMEALTGFINGIGSVINSTFEMIQPIISGLQETVQSVRDAINDAFTPEQQAAISNFFQTIGSAIVAVPFGILAAAVNVVTTAFSMLISTAGGILTFFTDILPAGIQVAVHWFEQIPSKISSAVDTAKNKISAWASNVVSTMRSGAQKAVDGVATFFGQLPEKIGGFLSSVIVSVANWANNMVAKSREAGSNVVNAVVTFFSQLPGKVASLLSNALSALVSWGTQMVGQARAKMQETATSIKSAFVSLPGELLRIGRNIIQGLLNGIEEKVGAVVDKVRGIAGKVKSAFSSVLGIHSPSRVFFAFGKNIVQGLVNGIKAASALAAKAASNLSNIVKGQVSGLNEEIERIETAAAERAAKKETAQYKASLKEKYEELGKAEVKERQKILDDIAKLQDDWNEKQLQKQEAAAKESLNRQITALEKISDEYEKAVDQVEKERDKLSSSLADSELFETDEFGNISLFDLDDDIRQIEAYGNAMLALRERGANAGLYSEILAMDMEKAQQYAKKLLSLSDDQFAAYMDTYAKKAETAAHVAESIYGPELDAINKEFKNKLPQSAGEAGEAAMDQMAAGILANGDKAVQAARAVSDAVLAELERINAAKQVQTSVQAEHAAVSAKLASSSSSQSEHSRAERNETMSDMVGAFAMAMNSGSQSREVVLNVNGKEFARATIDDIRSVEDQSPRIVSD